MLGLVSLRLKSQAHRVDTVALVRRRGELLTLEHMAQVPATLGAYDLDPRHAERGVFVSQHSTGQGIEERRPPTARVELRVRAEERSVATGTPIDALFIVLVVLTGAGPLSALLPQHSELLCAELRLPL